MNVKINSDFQFSVVSIQYTAAGELCITLASDVFPTHTHYQYSASLGSGQAEERPTISLLQYAQSFAKSANIKPKTKDTYRLMCNHLENYGDCAIDNVTTNYLQGFISHLQNFIQYLQSQNLKPGNVRLYFQKLACVHRT